MPSDTRIDVLAQRLDRLERRLRFYHGAFVALLVVAGVAALAGAGKQSSLPADELTCKRLIVKRDDGTEAGRLDALGIQVHIVRAKFQLSVGDEGDSTFVVNPFGGVVGRNWRFNSTVFVTKTSDDTPWLRPDGETQSAIGAGAIAISRWAPTPAVRAAVKEASQLDKQSRTDQKADLLRWCDCANSSRLAGTGGNHW